MYIDDVRDHGTVEHIYPQRARKDCWTTLYNHFSSKERSILRHSLGNLVPLSKPKNSSFQNRCFIEKLGNAESSVGFRYGSYAENEIALKSEWTAECILERGLKLLDFMEIRWGFQIGDRARKVRFLGLEFVENKSKAKTRPNRKTEKKTLSEEIKG